MTGGGDKEVAGGQIGPGLVASWGQGEQREGKRERKEERGGGKKRQIHLYSYRKESKAL